MKNHQVFIPEPFPEPFTLVSYPSGKKKEDHEDDAHYSEQKNPTPLLRHTECDGLYTFLINERLPMIQFRFDHPEQRLLKYTPNYTK
jgi:hypothetical protein